MLFDLEYMPLKVAREALHYLVWNKQEIEKFDTVNTILELIKMNPIPAEQEIYKKIMEKIDQIDEYLRNPNENEEYPWASDYKEDYEDADVEEYKRYGGYDDKNDGRFGINDDEEEEEIDYSQAV